jgi:hypothetical protein
MRSAHDVRNCHLLRVMRAVAPAEWNQGLPFPSFPGTHHMMLTMAMPAEVRVEPRLVAVAHDFDVPLPAFVERLAGRLDAHLQALAMRISELVDSYALQRRARSLGQLRLRELTRVQLARQTR